MATKVTTIDHLRKSCSFIGGIAGVACALLALLALGALANIGFGAAAPAESFVLYNGDYGSTLLAPGGPSLFNQGIGPNDLAAVQTATAPQLKNIYIVECAVSAVGLLAYAAICFVLFRVFKRDLKKNHTPFTGSTINGLRLIAVILAGLALLPHNIRTLLIAGITGTANFALQWPLNEIFVALVLLALAQVFAYGGALQQEVDETL